MPNLVLGTRTLNYIAPTMPRSRRRNRVVESTAVALAYLAATCAAFGPAEPTGRPLVDAALLAVATGLVVYAAASAPWWALTVAAGAALVVAGTLAVYVAAIAALALAGWIGIRRRNDPSLRALSAGIAFNALGWAELDAPFGVTAAVALAAGVLVLVSGLRRRPRAIRRTTWQLLVVVAGAVVLSLAGFGVAAAGAQDGIEEGWRSVQDGIVQLNRGEFAAAADEFERAATTLGQARSDLSGWWAAGASTLPVASQHRHAALELSEWGSQASAEIAAALRELDPASLRLSGGRIDVDAVAAAAEPLERVQALLARADEVIAEASSPWLVAPVADALNDLDHRIDDNAPLVANAAAAARVGPGLLGADTPRTYLVLFTTPAEARGLGGFIGNYAEIRVDAGQIVMSEFGRVADLERIDLEVGTRISEPAGFLDQYGRFGYLDDAGLVRGASWRNLTYSPHLPWVGEVAQQLYLQETGVDIDGVITIDPYVVEALLRYSGPIRLPAADVVLSSDNAAEYLLRGQYGDDPDQTERIDALEQAADAMMSALLAGELPDPTSLARDLGPLVAERRLLMWTDVPAEQELLRGVGLLGEIPPHAGADGWSFTVNNSAGSKIDTFLTRRAAYTSTTDPATGRTSATLRVELTNSAPSSGLPEYIIGSASDLPPGTSRLYVTFYSPLRLDAATRDGEDWGLQPGHEAGWNTWSNYVRLDAGETVTLELSLSGRVADPGQLVTWTQPLTSPLVVED